MPFRVSRPDFGAVCDRVFADRGLAGADWTIASRFSVHLIAYGLRGTSIRVPCWAPDASGENADVVISGEGGLLCLAHYRAIPADSYWRRERGGTEGADVMRGKDGIWRDAGESDDEDGRPLPPTRPRPEAWWRTEQQALEQLMSARDSRE